METHNNYRLFANRECEYYPCHKTEGEFNCLFCYCPLYALGEKCGGNYTYTKKGIKSCSECLFPHMPESYDVIIARFEEISNLVKKER